MGGKGIRLYIIMLYAMFVFSTQSPYTVESAAYNHSKQHTSYIEKAKPNRAIRVT